MPAVTHTKPVSTAVVHAIHATVAGVHGANKHQGCAVQAMSEQGTTQQQAVDAKHKELEAQQAAARAAQDKLQEQIAQLTQQCNR